VKVFKHQLENFRYIRYMKATERKYDAFVNAMALDSNLLADDAQIFNYARKGVAASVFYSFAEAIKVSNTALAALLHLSSRTLSNYEQTSKSLDPVQGEHLLKLIALYDKGIELFGSIDEFKYWLNKPFWNADEKPADWLITPGGIDLVAKELDQLGYGYPV
jgi:putative toxin-antitoxin system antitoxin component (TIGR02293 family)